MRFHTKLWEDRKGALVDGLCFENGTIKGLLLAVLMHTTSKDVRTTATGYQCNLSYRIGWRRSSFLLDSSTTPNDGPVSYTTVWW